MDTRGQVRVLAHSKVAGFRDIPNDPIEMLQYQNWNVSVESGTIDQSVVARANLEFEDTYCLGRVAQAAALVEKQFPEAQLAYGEVWEDFLRNKMLGLLSHPPKESELQEILLYEEPHAVLVVNDQQFDPITSVIGVDISHPRIERFSLWEGVASAWLVARASLETEPSKKLSILDEAEEICPQTTLVAENRCAVLIQLGNLNEARKLVEKLIVKRPVARSLYVGHLLGVAGCYEQFVATYPLGLIQYLERG